MSDWETIASTGLSTIALAFSIAAYVNGERSVHGQASVLIYDAQHIASQIAPYVEAGQDPLAVIDAAVDGAVEKGFILIDARVEVVAPQTAKLQLQDFVEVGQSLPVQLEAVDLHQSSDAGAQTPSTAPPSSDLRDMARQLYGTKPAFTIPQEGRN